MACTLETSPSRIASRHFLRAWRTARGLSQEDLASRLGVTHDRVSKWENGAPITEAKLYALCDALRLNCVADFFRDPSDHDSAWGIASRIMVISPERRAVLLDALAGIEAGDTGTAPAG